MIKEKPKSIRTRRSRSGSSGPTVDDVARAAGVSAMTVSRVVNLEPNVRPATKAKVQAAIDALGYVPNSAARNLAGGQQCRLALLYSNPSAAYLSEFLMGCLAQAALIDAQLIVEFCDPAQPVQAMVQRLRGHRADGVLLPPPLCDDEALLAALRAAGLPVAQIATGRPLATALAVTIDDKAAAHAMTAHLIALGHRRIGFIAGDIRQSASLLRRAGYEAALAEAGLIVDPALITQGDYSYRSGLAAAEILLAVYPRPTAIFASNDDMAAAALAVAHRHHLDVPGDIAICGFDDTAMATTIWPELTTIRQPIAEMARRATANLTEAVRALAAGRKLPLRHDQLDYTLISRDSVSAPPRQ